MGQARRRFEEEREAIRRRAAEQALRAEAQVAAAAHEAGHAARA
eukprot:COSAG01_NODE_8126_length_2911_cov_52.880156_1_plen_43_part_10